MPYLSVIVGAHDITSSGTAISIKSIKVHSSYNSGNSENDIAILELSKPADSKYKPIELASNSDSSPGTVTTVSGWGTTKASGNLSDVLLKVDVPIQSLEKCRKSYGSGDVHDTNVCAGYDKDGKDSCQGDSGGPLFVNKNNTFYQVGVVSWGEGCAEAGNYGVYTKVSSFTDFINKGSSGGSGSGNGGGGNGGCSNGSINVTLKIDNNGNETEWEIKSQNGNVEAKDGMHPANTKHKKSVNLSSGNYKFTIYDKGGDGLSNGKGLFKVSDSSGKKIAKGRNFGNEESTDFCVK